MPTTEEIARLRARLTPEQRTLLQRRMAGEDRRRCSCIERRKEQTPARLSLAQQRLWMADRLAGDSIAYHTPVVLRMRGELDTGALCQAAARIVQRHDILRTTFCMLDDEPVQVVHAAREVAPQIVDMTDLPEAQRLPSALAHLRCVAERPFDLSEGPLLREVLVRLGPDDHLFAWIMHHIVCDGWSMSVLLAELRALYSAARAASPASLPPLRIQYADYAEFHREQLSGERLEGLRARVMQMLAGYPTEFELTRDHPRPAILSSRGARVAFVVPESVAERMRQLALQEKTSLFNVALAAFQVLLHRHSGETRFLIGAPVANRTHEDVEALVGFFSNMVALPADLSGRPSFRELLARVSEKVQQVLLHQELPFDALVRGLAPKRDLSRSPLVQVVFQLEHSPALEPLEGVSLEHVMLEDNATPFDLTMMLSAGQSGLHGALEYSSDLFLHSSAERLVAAYQALLAAAVELPDLAFDRLDALGSAQRAKLLREADGPRRDDDGRCLHELVEAQAIRVPNHVAITFADNRLTYRKLDERAEQLAVALTAAGVQPGARVAMLLEPSLSLPIGILAVMKAGASCVPLDAAYPQERIDAIVSDSGCTHAVTQAALQALLPRDLIAIRADGAANEPRELRVARPRVAPSDICYVLHTSGSTGRPRGIPVSHRGLTNQMAWMKAAFGLSAADTGLLKGEITFGPTLCELFAPLSVGGRVVIAPSADRRTGRALLDLLSRERITLLEIVPSLLGVLLVEAASAELQHLRHVFVAGEALSATLVESFVRKLPATRLHNLYGPSEASSAVSWCTVSHDRGSTRISIGRAIDNTSLYVVDSHLELAPPGAIGEICIASVALAPGYLNDEALTRERFVPCPFRPGERMYRSGDLGRLKDDGSLEFWGRRDRQVKVGGVRIELSEIEAALKRVDGVHDAVVTAARDERNPERAKHLVAYVAMPVQTLGPAALRSALQDLLPATMIPSVFVPLAELPLNAHGKVDHLALPSAPSPAEAGDAQTGTEVETRLASIVASLFELERVGPDIDFFQLGGHSVKALELVARVREEFGVELPVRAVFESPTVRELAARMQSAVPQLPPNLIARRTGEHAPLSYAQEQVLRVDERRTPGSSALALALSLRGPLDPGAFCAALAHVVSRHEPLHARLDLARGLSIPEGSCTTHALDPIDASHVPAAERTAHLRELADALTVAPFELKIEAPLRLRLVRFAADEHALVAVVHRAAYDAHSHSVLLRELTATYESLSTGREARLAPLEVRYGDFSAFQRRWLESEDGKRLLDRACQRLAGARLVLLPRDHDEDISQAGAPASTAKLLIASDKARALQHFCRKQRSSLGLVLLAAFAAVLYDRTGASDLAFSVPFGNRAQRATLPLIGRFSNAVPVRVDLRGCPTLSELIGRCARSLSDAQAFLAVPALALYDRFPAGSQERAALFGNTVNVVSAYDGLLDSFDMANLKVVPHAVSQDVAMGDHALCIEQHAGGLELALSYRSDVYRERTMTNALRAMDAVLAGCLADAHLPLTRMNFKALPTSSSTSVG
jgi:amino acid adenylation domain-containing protein